MRGSKVMPAGRPQDGSVGHGQGGVVWGGGTRLGMMIARRRRRVRHSALSRPQLAVTGYQSSGCVMMELSACRHTNHTHSVQVRPVTSQAAHVARNHALGEGVRC
jgi:hypothetical protein